MPRRTRPGAIITVTPDEVDADTTVTVTVTGTGLPDGPVNVGQHGETQWVTGELAWGQVNVIGGSFSVDYTREGGWPDNDAFELAEVYVQARPPGDDNRHPGGQIPELYAATTLYIRRE